MREFDSQGLHLAEYQGGLFEKSVSRFSCSTKVFLRRFYHSRLLNILDKNNLGLLSVPEEGLDEIEREFGETSYGKIKWNPDVLFWIGYTYRYISYTRDTETTLLMKLFPPEIMRDVYFVFHTQSMEWVVENLLYKQKLSEDIFDKNQRLMKALIKMEADKHNKKS